MKKHIDPIVISNIKEPIPAVAQASHRLWRPTTINVSEINAIDMNTQASHMSLLITNTINVLAFSSVTIRDVWTTTTDNDMNNDKESNTKKTTKDELVAMYACPSVYPASSDSGVLSWMFCAGNVKIAAKAMVAIRTATMVLEFIALFRPVIWSFFRFFFILFTRCFVFWVC